MGRLQGPDTGVPLHAHATIFTMLNHSSSGLECWVADSTSEVRTGACRDRAGDQQD